MHASGTGPSGQKQKPVLTKTLTAPELGATSALSLTKMPQCVATLQTVLRGNIKKQSISTKHTPLTAPEGPLGCLLSIQQFAYTANCANGGKRQDMRLLMQRQLLTVDGLPKRTVDQLLNRTVDQLLNRTVNQLLNRTVDQLLNRTVDQLLNRIVDQLLNRTVDQLLRSHSYTDPKAQKSNEEHAHAHKETHRHTHTHTKKEEATLC